MDDTIRIKKVYRYEPEPCDCCEGFWGTVYELWYGEHRIMSTIELEEVICWISDNTVSLDYEEEDWNDRN